MNNKSVLAAMAAMSATAFVTNPRLIEEAQNKGLIGDNPDQVWLDEFMNGPLFSNIPYPITSVPRTVSPKFFGSQHKFSPKQEKRIKQRHLNKANRKRARQFK